MPLVDFAERHLASLVARFDALDDLVRHRLLPLPAVRRTQRRTTRDSVVMPLQLQLLYHAHLATPLRQGPLSYGTTFLSLSPVSREQGDVAKHRPEVASASCHNEEVPQLMEPKRPGYEVRTLESVD
jgi:hypothetical protein